MGREGSLSFCCWYDGNTFEEKLVKEWVTEIAAAAKHYLAESDGSDHRVIARL